MNQALAQNPGTYTRETEETATTETVEIFMIETEGIHIIEGIETILEEIPATGMHKLLKTEQLLTMDTVDLAQV